MKPGAMLTMAVLNVALIAWAVWRGRHGMVVLGLGYGTVFAILSIWSFTWGQG